MEKEKKEIRREGKGERGGGRTYGEEEQEVEGGGGREDEKD